MARILSVLAFLLGLLIAHVVASCKFTRAFLDRRHLTDIPPAAPTFCKCTCFKNSTIIPLGPQSQILSKSSSPLFYDSHPPASRRSASASCARCTKSFCLEHRIPFCADAEEDDVATLCFQRDSNKDRIIVWGFMIGVVSLLGAAAVRRAMEWRGRGDNGGLGGAGQTGVGARERYAVLQGD